MPFSWTCPFCQKPATITNEDFDAMNHLISLDSKSGPVIIKIISISCPDPACKQLNIEARLFNTKRNPDGIGYLPSALLHSWSLLPRSNAKHFPSYIPSPVLLDYNEAYLIKDLSPKASATLSRRCLQGTLRDYWKVKPDTLYKEIDSLRDKIESLEWQAIDAVRKIGNIGAHMQADINYIIDVDSNEAELLLGLIEYLLDKWYIQRHEKQKMLEQIVKSATSKESKGKSVTPDN